MDLNDFHRKLCNFINSDNARGTNPITYNTITIDTLESNKLLKGFIKTIVTDKNEIIIPEFVYSTGLTYSKDRIYIKSIYDYNLLEGRSIEPLLKNTLITDVKLTKIQLNSGSYYYAGRGILLDSQFNPLYVSIIKIVSDPITNSDTYSKAKYINPALFYTQDDALCKLIIKKLIPIMSLLNKTIVITEDIKQLAGSYNTSHKPIDPITMQEELNSIIVENIDNILYARN